jgi:hypothetical protein
MAADRAQIATQLADETESDVILVNAAMDRGHEATFIDACATTTPRRKNAIVLIVTSGGDADVAYRMARCLQQNYENITAVIPGMCKSAGTLLAIGAHELAIADHGELGPLDVQLRKADDMWAATSGLTVMNAFTALQQKSEEAFTDFALSIKARSGGSVTFKTAADIATKMTVGLFSHIYQQIEVMHVGEAARAMNIAREYGERLDAVTDNLRTTTSLSQLIADYPSHGFVIDRDEAQTLFRRVRDLTKRERELCVVLGNLARSQSVRTPHIYFLSQPTKSPAKAAVDDKQGSHSRDPAGQESRAPGAANAAAKPAASAAVAEVIPLPTTGTGGASGNG